MSALIEEDLRTLGDPASGYRPISGFAIAGLLTGALSILALVHTAFLFIPIAAIGINWKALRSIHDLSPELAGRRLALAGLALALIFGLSAPALPFLKERADRYQSIQLASAWFTALRNGQTSLGLQCTLPKWMRVTEGVNPDAAYADLSGQKTLTRFAENPAVSALLELGKRAHVRYVGNVTMQIDEEKQTLVDLYSVTARQNGEDVSFFVRVTVIARLDKLRLEWSWEINKYELLSQPPEGIKV